MRCRAVFLLHTFCGQRISNARAISEALYIYIIIIITLSLSPYALSTLSKERDPRGQWICYAG